MNTLHTQIRLGLIVILAIPTVLLIGVISLIWSAADHMLRMDQEKIVLDESVFSGAYSFAKDKAAIFVVDKNGVGEVVELYLVHRFEGDALCEAKDGSGTIWFCRNRDAAVK